MLKDDKLAAIGRSGNVAQFVSFDAGDPPLLRHALIVGAPSVARTATEAIGALLAASAAKSVNVRSFDPGGRKGTTFRYELTDVDAAVDVVNEFAGDGLYTIVNETIDVHDGGISGVALGNVVEFAPDDTPRAVESEGIAALPRDVAERMLRTVYGPTVALVGDSEQRVEFSVHPSRVGHMRQHVTVWEVEHVGPQRGTAASIFWPNRFSRHIGDKAFGLLVAHVHGLLVPVTTVIGRRVAPFTFGTPTGTGEMWIRTCPAEQEPGLFTTARGWMDPFALLSKEDADGTRIASVLSQEGIESQWSGATLPGSLECGEDLIEGVRGTGEMFMLGGQERADLPGRVIDDVRTLLGTARERIGAVRIEWAHDGARAWVLQLHVVARSAASLGTRTARRWFEYDPTEGLDRLQELVVEVSRVGAGVVITRPIGVTSHVGDILRRADIPARFAS